MDVAEVYLWGTRIGAAVQDGIGDMPKFNYDKDFIGSGIELSPVVMPLSERIYSFPALSKQTFPQKNYNVAEDAPVDINALVELASMILTDRENIHISAGEDAMEQIINIGTSAGGARAKAVIAWNRQTDDIRSGQIDAGEGYEYWLIKFDGVKTGGR